MDQARGQHAALSQFKTTAIFGGAVWREQQWGQMHVGYETYLKDFEDTELLKGLPDDRCSCPHWGYLLTGRMTVRYADHEDVVEAGQVYYMAPGHTIFVEAGTTLLEFSPLDKFSELMKHTEEKLPDLSSA